MGFTAEYTKIENNSEVSDTSPTDTANYQWPHGHRNFFLGFAAALIVFAPIALLAWNVSGASSTFPESLLLAPAKGLHCGQSVDEAISLGCEFDMVSVAWTPKECIDQTSTAEFEEWLGSEERVHPWPFWEDRDAKKPLRGKDQLSHYAGKIIWTNLEYHIGHCAFEFRSLQRSISGDALVKSYMKNDTHTLHCLHTMLGKQDFDVIDTHFNTMFGHC
jgi:hypothetical protein